MHKPTWTVIFVALFVWSGCTTAIPKDKLLQQRAQDAYRRGNYATALAAINQAIAIDPNYSPYYLDRSKIYRQLGKLAQAEEDYQQYQKKQAELALEPTADGQRYSNHQLAGTAGDNDVRTEAIRHEAVEKMRVWQANMQFAFDQLEVKNKDDSLTTEQKAQAWEQFIRQFSDDNPYSTDDNDLRMAALEKIDAWRNAGAAIAPSSQQGSSAHADRNMRRSALVIGNSAYRSIPALRNPANDAQAMSRVLGRCGFDVDMVLDADRRDLFVAIRDFHQRLKAGNGGVGLFFYAGHGIQIDGENYLVPVDASVRKKFEVDLECYKMSALLAAMEESGSELNIVILDACRNNPFRGFRSNTRGLAIMNAPVGSILVYSTAPGEVAEDGDGNNGLFTAMLLKHILAADLTIEEILKRVRYEVVTATGGRQVPWESSSLIGDFYFRVP